MIFGTKHGGANFWYFFDFGSSVKMAVVKSSAKPVTIKFVIDCKVAAADTLLDPLGLEAFLTEKIKVDGKTGNFEVRRGNTKEKLIRVKADHQNRVCVDAVLPFKKRYLKYLTKKYLKKQQIRDFFRVISTGPTTYALKFFPAKSRYNLKE